ncbi:MAG: AAA domain-containing protein [Limnohabitans sp.]|nr:AAA domain-containing protein [Limnohabitans sp.]
MNEHKKILSCWHKLEHFSPASAPKSSDKGVEILKNQEQWKIPLKSNDPNKTIEYTIFLGVFDSKIVNDFVSKYFNNTEINENFRNSKICYASLKLDEIGHYVNDSFGLSTLPWAIAQLENNKIKTNNWEKEFEEVKENLKEFIDLNFKETITNSNNEVVEVSKIVNNSQLLNLQDKIEKLCNWSINPILEIYIKRDEKYKSKKDKDSNNSTEILNSFYIKDLETIISKYNEKSIPKAFKQYLDGCLNKQSVRVDIVKDINKLQEILMPSNYPDGCWPSEYTLSLMQQFAVNSIFNNLSDSKQAGMYSVNGPPGTGKTTLLRDIIAPIFVKRVKELIKIDNPADAFKKIGELKITEKYSPFLYEPIQSITNGGIVIASSNNGAVENISKELPFKKEVSKQYSTDISYFKPVAENCIDENNWGLFSAVLGNKSNINELISNIWFNKDVKDLQNTLKEDKITGNNEWNELRKLFNNKLKEISNEKDRLNSFIENYKDSIKTRNSISELNLNLEEFKGKYVYTKTEYENYGISVSELDDNKNKILNEISIIQNTKPNFFIYWINKNKRNLYNNRLESVLHKYEEISHLLNKLKPLKEQVNDLSKICKKILEDIEIQQKISTDLNNKILEAKAELKNNYADIDYWNNIESKKSQESCPWYSDKLKKLQSELFIISLKVNETFILTANATSSRISTTLSGFFEYLKGGSSASKQEIKAMWDTFFLVIPVISSSFASIQTLFKDLDKEAIPWLFIDEAGQAIPQAAVGSIWRSKRVGIVGDPFQIEPVVTIPKSITDNISNYFDLNNSHVSSELSVQSMADRINPLGSYLEFNTKKEWIGMPLRVHRRCISPMFDIANRIAYDNSMYNSTSNPKTVNVNFESSFIDCKGKVKGKHFVVEQAEIIKEILVSEINFNKGLPDIFVISPFSEISYELKKYLFNDLKQEVGKFKVVQTDEINNWLKSNIGTVHTFQGKQAEGVILCLGLDDKTKGASNWASEKPNLLNVAITRAKFRFIAIGDKDIWMKQNYFNQLQKLNE